MWYPPKVTIPPAEPVSVAEAKLQCNVLHDDDDALLGAIIAAARDHVEGYCGTPLATQTVEVKCDDFCDMARLPIAPAQSVTTIIYTDTSGDEQTLSASVYEERFDGLEAAVVPAYGQRWPVKRAGSRITLTAVVGYETTPPAVKHAMLLWIAEAYLNRENAETPGWTAFDALLTNYRR
ncbi:head-tail connector protein [Shinella sp. M31]|uniref:head-tail connector protein n=1 Tax=Shinella sp. M31 TaxID=3368615 RepID=UPI003B9DE034